MCSPSPFSSLSWTHIAPPQILLVMDKFELQFSKLDVQTSYMEDAMGLTMAMLMLQDQVDVPDITAPEHVSIVGKEDSN